MTGTKLTFEELKKRKKPNTKEVPILLDPEIGIKYNECLDKILKIEQSLESDDSNRSVSSELKTLNKERDLLEKELEENTVVFKIKALNPEAFDEILNDNPPTSKQIKEAHQNNRTVEWNPETVPPVLVAACLVEPELSEDDVKEIWKDPSWNSAELLKLFEAAMSVNYQVVSVNLKKD